MLELKEVLSKMLPFNVSMGLRDSAEIKALRAEKLQLATKALLEGDIVKAERFMRDVSHLSAELGDHEIAVRFFNQAEHLRRVLVKKCEYIFATNE